MKSVSDTFVPEKSGVWQPILFGGLLAGILDITAASVQTVLNDRTPVRMLQTIASGLLGAESYNGGYAAAALGLAIHFFIALTAAAVFYLASRRLKFMVNQAILSGALYGIAVWMFMNLVVIPLRFSKFPDSFSAVLPQLLIHIFCVGLSIALVVRWFSK